MLWLAVAIGGSVGALARYAVSELFSPMSFKFPLATLAVNLLGSLLIGVMYVVIVEKVLLPPIARQLIIVGFLGAFTTFSAFSIESLHLLQAGQWQVAVIYAVLSFFGGIAAVFCGIFITEKII